MRFIVQQQDVWRVLRNASKHTASERKRAYFFLFAYCLSVAALFASFLHFIGAWVAAGLIQLVMLIFAMLYALNIADCRDKCLNVLECERIVNPVMEVYVGLRALQLLHAIFFIQSIVLSLCYTMALLFLVWRISRGAFFVDATSLWREVGRLEQGSYFHISIDVLLFVVYLVCMVFAIVARYAK
ncbi:hypothetical protein C3747_120g123 [Trypanosoma cruzi]|uniref:Cornichon protein n=2 Tax=Trypanosoma cruzi TaxID=5693 RepID=Q4CSV3_TRYCC|nr:hypothetical protein, conserved [Trypanosoma cruzi]EAN83357.1 hypothetical protein, conserved [Trypanosoma cruzi]PWV06057.1 hypothetical protein C3747_120g123 [Trypanosoma cruzi]|eukprot:XP_805208.1 hypothetical protein [Trypanosoma cruzi strain CL Brener]